MALKPSLQNQPSSGSQLRSKSQRLLISELQKQAAAMQSTGQLPGAESNSNQDMVTGSSRMDNQERKDTAQQTSCQPEADKQHALTSSHHSKAAVPDGLSQEGWPTQPTAESNGDQHALTSSHQYSAAAPAESAQQDAAEQSPAAASAHQRAGMEAQEAKLQQSAAAEAREAKLESLLEVYEEPDFHAGLYNYAKALEDVEAGLLAGFFYKHYCLASNVIGSESKGK